MVFNYVKIFIIYGYATKNISCISYGFRVY